MAKNWHDRGLAWPEAVRRAQVVHRGVYNSTEDLKLATRIANAIDTKVLADFEADGISGRALNVTFENRLQMLKQRDIIKKHTRLLFEDAVTAGPDAFEEALEKGERREAFWARDQVGTMSSQFQKTRGNQAGAVGFIWVRTKSDHPRNDHLDKVGNFYEYDYGGELPGELFNCKCGMKPVYEVPEHRTRKEALEQRVKNLQALAAARDNART